MDSAAVTLEGTRIELETHGLRKMVEQVIFAASTDESRPTLTGVEVTFKDARITMAATDGYRLSLRSAPVTGRCPPEPMTVIVPAKSLGEFARISADADDSRPVQVIVTQARNQILFQIWGKNLEGKARQLPSRGTGQPADRRPLPGLSGHHPQDAYNAHCGRYGVALKAVRVAFLFARDNANIIRMRIDPANGGTRPGAA